MKTYAGLLGLLFIAGNSIACDQSGELPSPTTQSTQAELTHQLTSELAITFGAIVIPKVSGLREELDARSIAFSYYPKIQGAEDPTCRYDRLVLKDKAASELIDMVKDSYLWTSLDDKNSALSQYIINNLKASVEYTTACSLLKNNPQDLDFFKAYYFANMNSSQQKLILTFAATIQDAQDKSTNPRAALLYKDWEKADQIQSPSTIKIVNPTPNFLRRLASNRYLQSALLVGGAAFVGKKLFPKIATLLSSHLARLTIPMLKAATKLSFNMSPQITGLHGIGVTAAFYASVLRTACAKKTDTINS